MRRISRLFSMLLVGLLLLGSLALHAPTSAPRVAQAGDSCGLSAPAFCDTFSEGPHAGGRSGDLDPSTWSVARTQAPYNYMGNGNASSFEEFPSVPVTPCRAGVSSVRPDSDALICDSSSANSGQLMTATGGQDYGTLSYRPTQPFDFTNRTGTIVFDVDATTGGGLDKWISLFITDQPIPGAENLTQVAGLTPQNGVGVNFDINCTAQYADTGVGAIYTYTNTTESVAYHGATSKPCVATSAGKLNHFEIDLSQSQIQVWGSDYSPDGVTFPNVQLLATAPLSLPFSVGYVHYQVGIRAPAKYQTQFHLNAPYALYHWKDVGFDGPVLPRERVYPVPDALTTGPNGGMNTAYQLVEAQTGGAAHVVTCCAATTIAPFTLPGVDLTNATDAQVTLDAFVTAADAFNASTFAIQYRFNGGAWQTPNPAPNYQALLTQSCPGCPGGSTGSNLALALPVPLSALVQGTNTLEITTANASQGYPVLVANIDLVVSTSTMSVTSTATRTPPTATPSETATATPMPTTPIPPTFPPTPGGPAPYQLIAHLAAGSTTQSGFTTAPLDTAGADLLVAAISDNTGSTVLTDSLGNTWRKAAGPTTINGPDSTLYYASAAHVGTTQTFTLAGTGTSPSVVIAAFSGGDGTLDAVASASALFASNLAPGSVQPHANQELVVTAVADTSTSATAVITAPFTRIGAITQANGMHFGGGLAYLIQTTATAENPTWSGAGSALTGATIATVE